MGYCRYEYNPSELYRRTTPGTAPETTCGARTFPAIDEPEQVVVRTGMGPDGAIYEYRQTGAFVPRSQDDPYCPDHGGSPPPPPPPVSAAELEYAYRSYQELAARFAGQPGGAIAAQVPEPQLSLAPAPADASAEAPVTAADLAAAAAHMRELAARAGEAA